MYDISEYFGYLETRLRIEPARRSEVLREARSHVVQRSCELRREGLAPADADRRALRDFGDPRVVADSYYAVHATPGPLGTLLAVAPHLVLAAIFALHLWTDSFWVVTALAAAALVGALCWRRGLPQWAYPWLGYAVLLPTVAIPIGVAVLGHSAMQAFRGQDGSLGPLDYVVITLWMALAIGILVKAVRRGLQHDWIVVSLAALPVPFLTAWLFLLHWHGGVLIPNMIRTLQADTATAIIFVALGITTAVFMQVGHRGWRIAILLVPTPALVCGAVLSYRASAAALDVIVALGLTFAFLLSPLLWTLLPAGRAAMGRRSARPLAA